MLTGVSDASRMEGGPGFDPTVPNVARIYDYMLGGKDNFAADRQLAEQIMANVPTSAWSARQQRAFVVRAVRYCAQQGIGQFLDIGSGLPTMDNAHEVARRVIPEAAVVYVDIDPVALSHARALLATSPGVAARPAGSGRLPAYPFPIDGSGPSSHRPSACHARLVFDTHCRRSPSRGTVE